MLPVSFAMPVFGSRFEDQAYRAAALAAGGRVVQRSGDVEFFDGVRVGQGNGIEVGQIEIVDVDSFQCHAVVAGALPVHVDVDNAAVGVSHIGHLARGSGRKRKQEHEVRHRQGQRPQRRGIDGLSRGGALRVHCGGSRRYFHHLIDRAHLKPGVQARSLVEQHRRFYAI